jgi:hypothetical protein
MSLFFNPYAYDLGYFMSREESESDVKSDKVMFIAANNVTDREISFGKTILCRDISIQMKLGRPIGIGSKNRMEIYRSANLYKFTYGVSCVTDAGRYQWDGSDWELQDNSIKLVKEYDYNQSTLDISLDVKLGLLDQSAALLIFTIYKIEYRLVGYASIVDYGIYARIEHFAYAITDEESNAENFKVEVLYDEQYNNLISRETQFLAPAKAYFSPKVIKNGIYLPESGYPPAKPWNWPGDTVQTELQVLIAQQILLYNSKPNNLLTGTLVSEDKMLRLPGIWTYNGKKHVLISGSLDLITGYLEDVKLREYVEWDDIYPETYLLTTEDAQNVLTEDSNTIQIGI